MTINIYESKDDGASPALQQLARMVQQTIDALATLAERVEAMERVTKGEPDGAKSD